MLVARCACLLTITLLAPALQASSIPANPPEPQIFSPGIISGPGGDGSPTFSPDGKTLFFTRSAAHWTVILESHFANGKWSQPKLAPFSGRWPDSSPTLAPDGSYLVFQSTRPKVGENKTDAVSNLWRVDRQGTGWNQPARLPDAVNLNGQSIWKPSIAADGTIYFASIDPKGNKRLFSSQFIDGAFQTAQPLAFSDGTTADVDPEIAPDGAFLVFSSSGRLPADVKDHLFIVLRKGKEWGAVVPLRYAGDDQYGYSTDDEARLGPDHRTLYFNTDRAVSVHFPRTPEQALRDLKQMEEWDNGNTNVWTLPLDTWLH